MLVVICHNTKLEKLTNSILQELHKELCKVLSLYPSYASEYFYFV